MLSKIMSRATLEECRKKWFLEFYIFFCHRVASYLMLLKMVKESLTKNPLSVPTSAAPPQLRHTLPCCGQRPFLFFKATPAQQLKMDNPQITTAFLPPGYCWVVPLTSPINRNLFSQLFVLLRYRLLSILSISLPSRIKTPNPSDSLKTRLPSKDLRTASDRHYHMLNAQPSLLAIGGGVVARGKWCFADLESQFFYCPDEGCVYKYLSAPLTLKKMPVSRGEA